MSGFGKAIDHICMTPKGRVNMNSAKGRMTKHEKRVSQRIRTDSFVATTIYRSKLAEVEVVYHDSSWCHVQNGNVLARFSDVGAAVAAL